MEKRSLLALTGRQRGHYHLWDGDGLAGENPGVPQSCCLETLIERGIGIS